MFSRIKLVLVVISGLIYCENAHSQTTVGMGTDAPNPNAVLELVSEHQNQGFLMPRLTTSQRNASSFTGLLSSKDNGLLVFDTDKGIFYYWYNNSWQAVGQGSNDGTTPPFWYVGNAMPTNAQGKDGDFYLHQSTGNVYRKQGNTFVLIGNLQNQGKQYTAGAGIVITNQNEIVNTGDTDPANELQTLSLSGSTLSLSGSPSTVDLSVLQDGTGTDSQNLSNSKTGEDVILNISGGTATTFSVADNDNDATNEVQDLSLSSNELKITNNAAATPIDLTPYLDNTDSQNLSLAGTNLAISGGNSVDLSVLQDGTGTDSQTLSLAGNNLSITGGNSVDISSINTDSQTLSLSGNNLSIAEGNSVNLSSYLDNTDSQNLSNSKTGEDVTLNISGGSATTFSVADNDSNVSNETITSTTLNANVLEITEAGTKHTVDLSSIKGSPYTGGEGIAILGTTVTAKADSVTIGFDASDKLKVLDDGITDTQIANVAPSKLLAGGAAHGDVLKYNNVSGKWEPIAPTASTVTRYYSIDPTDFVSVNGASNMKYNGIDGSSSSTAGGSSYMAAPIHLPQGAIIEEVEFYVYDLVPLLLNLTCSLQSKLLSSEATTDHVTRSTVGSLGNYTLTATGLSVTVDNSVNSYRIKIETADNTHKVYGVRITYTETL